MWKARAGGASERKEEEAAEALGMLFTSLTLAIVSALWIGEEEGAGGRAGRKVRHVGAVGNV